MKELLITGASGLLGANLVLEAADEYEVVAVCHRHPIAHEGLEVELADLSLPGEADRLIRIHKPEAVIHCAAATDLEACERDPDWAFRHNRDMARYIAEACQTHGSALVHVSTDAVFDGSEGPYGERDHPGPINVYGQSKLAGERAVLESCERAAVVRCNFFGWNAHPKRSLAEWFLERLASGRVTPGFSDVWVSPMLTTHLARLLLQVVKAGGQGLFHAPGADCVSKYEFGRRLAEVFDLDPGLVEPASVDDAGLVAPRGKRLCLRGEKIRQVFGVRLPSLEEGLRAFRRQAEDGYRQRLRALAGRDTA